MEVKQKVNFVCLAKPNYKKFIKHKQDDILTQPDLKRKIVEEEEEELSPTQPKKVQNTNPYFVIHQEIPKRHEILLKNFHNMIDPDSFTETLDPKQRYSKMWKLHALKLLVSLWHPSNPRVQTFDWIKKYEESKTGKEVAKIIKELNTILKNSGENQAEIYETITSVCLKLEYCVELSDVQSYDSSFIIA